MSLPDGSGGSGGGGPSTSSAVTCMCGGADDCKSCAARLAASGSSGSNSAANGGVYHSQEIDNSVKVLEKIAGLYAERLLSDIVLEVNGKPYASHRLILCASSDVFQVMLMNPNWSESQEKVIVLQEEPDCARVFPEFLKYLYTGIININHRMVLPVVTMADKYNVRDLIALCVRYMRKHIVSATRHGQLVRWLHYMLTCGHDELTAECVDFVAANFEAVSETDDFCSLETEVLIHFLRKSDLVVRDEYRLLQIVTRWLEAQEERLRLVGDEFFDSMVPLVMSFVRFPMLEPRRLADLLINPLMIRYKEFFVQRMSLAMVYHTSGATAGLRAKLPALSFTPRLYTTEKWSSSLVIENYRNLPVYGCRTLVFNTPSALSECDAQRRAATASQTQTSLFADQCCPHEWAIECYPKGIWFKKFQMIHYNGCLEVPEWVSKTVRLTVRQSDKGYGRRVSIGILLSGRVDGIEYVHRVVQKTHIFTNKHRLVNIDDVIPFDELNESILNTNGGGGGGGPAGAGDAAANRSLYLVGADSDTLKIQVVITPLSDDN